MQEFDLVVVKAAEANENPRDTYRVEVTFMHGDADGETVKHMDFPANEGYTRNEYEPSIEEVLIYLKTFFDLEWNDGCDFCTDCDTKQQALAAAGLDDEAIERCEADFLWEGDMTADNQFQARPSEAKISYFDANGVEFEVSAFLKGTKEKVSLARY